jgi:hypothetical protein
VPAAKDMAYISGKNSNGNGRKNGDGEFPDHESRQGKRQTVFGNRESKVI